ncbi:MAG: hypothetical protein M1461_01040 [Nitrospirae bacterium]|nr:hypothetical protein [Nitrospirota bacterium]
MLNERENLLRAAAASLFDELAAPPAVERTVPVFLAQNPKSAVVIFDGCSLREMPRLLDLAGASGRKVIAYGCSRAAVPSETEYFISDRLGLGLPAIGPSQLSSRSELKQSNIRFYYYGQTTDYHTIRNKEESLLLWSRFPDQRYTDSTATNETMFDGIWDGLEQAWKRTVQAVPPDRTVLVTSDHGYIFLGPGLSDPALKGADRVLDGKRYRFFSSTQSLPQADNGLWVDKDRRLGVLAGRGHNRFPGPGAQSVYRHGGLTLLETLTPWIELGPVK